MLIDSTDPLLHRPSKLITDEQLADYATQLQPSASLLVEHVFKFDALGISACQIGIDLAMFVMLVDGQPKICVNPQIVAASFNMEMQKEGCLSYPNLHVNVRRPTGAMVRYHTLDGQEVTEHLEGLAARIWLHEYDHVNGICFVDRVGKLSLSMAKKRMAKKQKKEVR